MSCGGNVYVCVCSPQLHTVEENVLGPFPSIMAGAFVSTNICGHYQDKNAQIDKGTRSSYVNVCV